jgi:hypothetical protein
MKWPRYQRVISLETQVGITSQRNKWANTGPRKYWRRDKVSMRSKQPLSTGRNRLENHLERNKSVLKISISKLGKQTPQSKSVGQIS